MPGNPGYGLRDRVLVTMLTRTGGLLGRMRRDGFLRKQSDQPPVYVLTAKGAARARASKEKALP